MNNSKLDSLNKARKLLESYNKLLPCMDEKTFSKFKNIRSLHKQNFKPSDISLGAFSTCFFIKEKTEEQRLELILKNHQKALFNHLEETSAKLESSDGFIYYEDIPRPFLESTTFKNEMRIVSNLNVEKSRLEFYILAKLDEIKIFKKSYLYEQY